jgi:carboxyl-terminal processing protease
MRKTLTLAIAMLAGVTAFTQTSLNKAATDAYVITRMAAKFHVQPKPLNDELSAAVFDRLMNELDESRIYFTQEDIKALSFYRLQLDDEIKDKKIVFLQLLSSLYQTRLQQVDSAIDVICKTSFDLNAAEKFTVAEDTTYPANAIAQKVKLRKIMKWSVLDAVVDDVKAKDDLTSTQQKKFIDSVEFVYRKWEQKTFKRSIKRSLQSPGGIASLVGETYCEMIATYYDPHTNYFSETTKDNFQSQLGDKTMMFGFGLKEDEDGHVTIGNLKAGSPAYQSGQLNEGDKIKSIEWEGKESIDVSDADVREVSNVLGASNHEKAKISVQKADGTTREVVLAKAKMDNDVDNDKVKSFLLKGPKTVGYISLPAFYEDWENEDNNVNGCANDVAKEILKLKKENIDALVIDVRYNGGGSLQETSELAGIFIDAGPLAQLKGKEEKAYTLKDGNRGTIYDGPLLLMVNGYSASASEMLAGTLQDYNRALIVGSPTYGKATAQIVLPMDTTISMDKDFAKKQTDSYIKMTTSKLYRVNGTTAQFAGVKPDVILPDVIDANPHKEANEIFALPATGIEGNKYFKPLPGFGKELYQQFAKSITDTLAYFKLVKEYISSISNAKMKKDISLNWKDALQLRKKSRADEAAPEYGENKKEAFVVMNNAYEEQRLKANKDMLEMNDAWKAFLKKDPYLQITYGLALLMIK